MHRVLLSVALAACTRPDAATRDLGGPCASPAECNQLRCLPRPAWPLGFCTKDCAEDRECPVAAACSDGVCLFSCFDDQDCGFLGTGYGCRKRGPKLVCAPDLPDGGTAHAP